MKIFKLENNTIICTLSRNDLNIRDMKISELAKSTENAEKLFNEIMNYTKKEFNYNPQNIPLTIEAKPINNDIILLAIYEYPN